MTDKPEKPETADKPGWKGKKTIAGAAIGSAAITAALLFASRRKDRDKTKGKTLPPPPETD